MKIKPFAKPGECAAPSFVEGLSLPYDRFKPVGQKGADRPPFLGCQDSRLAQEIGIQLQSDIGLHD